MFKRKISGFLLIICCLFAGSIAIVSADEEVSNPGETRVEKGQDQKKGAVPEISNDSITSMDDSVKLLDPTKFPVDVSEGGGKVTAVFYDGILGPENLIEADLVKLPDGTLVRITPLSDSARKTQGKRIFKALSKLIANGAKFVIFDDERENTFDDDGNRVLKAKVDDRDISDVLKIEQ